MEQPRPKPFACSQCTSTFARADHLRRHMKSHSSEPRPYTCSYPQCPYAERGFLDNYHLRRHLITAHQPSISCCDLNFKKRSHWLKHRVLVHNQAAPFECKECNPPRPFFSELKYDFHLQKGLHSSQKDVKFHKRNTGPFQCDKCDQKLKSYKQFRRHMKEIHEQQDELHACSQCAKVFQQRRNLLAHIKTKHSPPKFNCQNCQACFRHKKSLLSHISLQHSEEPQTEVQLQK